MVWAIRIGHVMLLALVTLLCLNAHHIFGKNSETAAILVGVFSPIVLIVTYVILRDWYVGVTITPEPEDVIKYSIAKRYRRQFQLEFREQIFRGHAHTFAFTTNSSNPLKLFVSEEKLRQVQPDMFGFYGALKNLWAFFRNDFSPQIYIEEQLMFGDGRAAVVVQTAPLLVAAYSDEIDGVAILRFPDEINFDQHLKVGSKLLNAAGYCEERHNDLIIGPEYDHGHVDLHPIIVDFITDEIELVKQIKHRIPEHEWKRAFRMGKEYISMRPGISRDGRPWYAGKPAKM